MLNIDKSEFTKNIIKCNSSALQAFKEWIFYPGMLFGSEEKWWNKGKRDNPHEGLDLCFYKDQIDRICLLDEQTKIPAIFNGMIVGIFEDFLGKSIIVEHVLNKQAGSFCTIFGHVIPKSGIATGSRIKQGEPIALISGTGKSKSKILPHLHISLGRVSEGISYGGLDWKSIGNPEKFSLQDPILLIENNYKILNQFLKK